MTTTEKDHKAQVVAWVTAVSDWSVLQRHLLTSPDVAAGQRPLHAVMGATSAAAAFNPLLAGLQGPGWLVWVHQDVHLPAGWLARFESALASAQRQFPRLAVAGVYGVCGRGEEARHAGHLLDRGRLLHPPLPLPCRADSLDELLVAVRLDRGLRMDAALGFDFYATDLVLQAQARSLECVIVDAYCEHWSSTNPDAPLPPMQRERLLRSAAVFEAKWADALPVTTPCVKIFRPGDTARFLAHLEVA